MRLRNSITILLAALCLVLPSCKGGKASRSSTPQPRQFIGVEIPSVYDNPGEALIYAADHYWDNFLKEGFVTDSTKIAGVPQPIVQQALADYLTLLDKIPVSKAQDAIRGMFEKVSAVQASDSTSAFFTAFTSLLCDYMYEANSPYRNEDLYLALLEGLCESPYTSREMMPAFVFQKEKCSLNRYMTKVPDILFRDRDGRQGHLYGVKARYTLLLFSNPGCRACMTVIDALSSSRRVSKALSDGSLAIVSMYIDEDRDLWYSYVSSYPEQWTVAYNYDFTVRESPLWYVRAIPSLYLLDEGKRVILKDSPTEKIIEYLSNNN